MGLSLESEIKWEILSAEQEELRKYLQLARGLAQTVESRLFFDI
ncbi:hypothetical protein [Psychromonas ingrahamii]|nr:hypothetical protein [Psychromonas ingrahamii]